MSQTTHFKRRKNVTRACKYCKERESACSSINKRTLVDKMTVSFNRACCLNFAFLGSLKTKTSRYSVGQTV